MTCGIYELVKTRCLRVSGRTGRAKSVVPPAEVHPLMEAVDELEEVTKKTTKRLLATLHSFSKTLNAEVVYIFILYVFKSYVSILNGSQH